MEISKKDRKVRTQSEWEQLISEQMASGMSGSDFCDARGICKSVFWRWRKQLSSLVRHGVKSLEPTDKGRFITMQVGEPSQPRVRAELELGDGIVLRVMV